MTTIDTTPSRYFDAPFAMPSFANSGAFASHCRSPSPATFDTTRTKGEGTLTLLDEEEYLLEEDETSIRVTMDMPGVKGTDISVSIQDGVLIIEGYRRSAAGDEAGSRRKKQRLQHRLPVDVRVVDVSRAVAQIWKDSLVLYAPKQSRPASASSSSCYYEDEEPEMELFSPAADRLRQAETATE